MPEFPSGWSLSCVGDSTLVVETKVGIDPLANSCALEVANAFRQQGREGVRDVVEGYYSVTVHFDPLKVDIKGVIAGLQSELSRVCSLADRTTTRRCVTVPVCYGGEYGPDLDVVADFADCKPSDVIHMHASPRYRVYMLGFLPGFAYMGSVPRPLGVPRRDTPRLIVPSGSVGIAGRQTGVYPIEAPGGWQLVGRTPLAIFNLEKAEPFLFRPGDEVIFEPITPKRFKELREELL